MISPPPEPSGIDGNPNDLSGTLRIPQFQTKGFWSL
jgi:hypothetical protein